MPPGIGEARGQHEQDEASDVEGAIVIVENTEEQVELAIEPPIMNRAKALPLAREEQERERRQENHAGRRQAQDRSFPRPWLAPPQRTQLKTCDQHAVDDTGHQMDEEQRQGQGGGDRPSAAGVPLHKRDPGREGDQREPDPEEIVQKAPQQDAGV